MIDFDKVISVDSSAFDETLWSEGDYVVTFFGKIKEYTL